MTDSAMLRFHSSLERSENSSTFVSHTERMGNTQGAMPMAIQGYPGAGPEFQFFA